MLSPIDVGSSRYMKGKTHYTMLFEYVLGGDGSVDIAADLFGLTFCTEVLCDGCMKYFLRKLHGALSYC